MNNLKLLFLSMIGFITISNHCTTIVETYYCTIDGKKQTFEQAGITSKDITNALPVGYNELVSKSSEIGNKIKHYIDIIYPESRGYQYSPQNLNKQQKTDLKNLQNQISDINQKLLNFGSNPGAKKACENKGGEFSIEITTYGPGRSNTLNSLNN